MAVGREVEPQDPVLREQFRLEEELGRLPLDMAFGRLVSRVPELSVWRTAVEGAKWRYHVSEIKSLEKIVGPHSVQSDALARSPLAEAVATEYLSVLASKTSRGDVRAPYFALIKRPNTTVIFDRRESVRQNVQLWDKNDLSTRGLRWRRRRNDRLRCGRRMATGGTDYRRANYLAGHCWWRGG